jgi:cell division protein FtsI (penicillin-binding protein 3)
MALTGQDILIAGTRGNQDRMMRTRIRITIIFLVAIFVIVGVRLIQFGQVVPVTTIDGQERAAIEASRPALLDRNGLDLATDLRVPSLFADPRRIVDLDEAILKLRAAMPELSEATLRKQLSGDRGFVWVKREVTPQLRDKVMALGLPGIDYLTESKRFYPGGTESSHLVGTTNIDSQGISGMEKSIDDSGVALLQTVGIARAQALSPTRLSIDLRVQYALWAELSDALTRYQAIASAGVMLNAKTGEVIAMVSLPDFDPNDPATALLDGRLNRITAGAYELGSTFKSIAFAAALDSGKVSLRDSFDASTGVKFGRFTINDFHGQNRILTVPEIYQYSSNVGTIKMVQALGKDDYRAFLTRIGFDDPLVTELPERARTNVPKVFSEVTAATAAFGHGLSITPMHMAAAMVALVNGGDYITPTFYPRTVAEARGLYRRVVTQGTSDRIRYLMRLNAMVGSGTRMNKIANGYRVGGKTGTAEKVINGRYSSEKNLNTFAAAFPIDDPQYVLLIIVDEPKAENPASGATAGWNAGEVAGRVIQRTAVMLGLTPNYDDTLDGKLVPPELAATPFSASTQPL